MLQWIHCPHSIHGCTQHSKKPTWKRLMKSLRQPVYTITQGVLRRQSIMHGQAIPRQRPVVLYHERTIGAPLLNTLSSWLQCVEGRFEWGESQTSQSQSALRICRISYQQHGAALRVTKKRRSIEAQRFKCIPYRSILTISTLGGASREAQSC